MFRGSPGSEGRPAATSQEAGLSWEGLSTPASIPTCYTEGMVQLFNAETGEISQAQLEFLVAQMEEEHPEDQDYYLNADLLEAWREQGADSALLTLLQKAMGDKEELTIRWSK